MVSSGHEKGARSTTISLRIAMPRRDLIDRAAKATGKTRTDFILESAARAAEEALLDRRMFQLDDAAYSAFVAALDAPLQPHAVARLRKLLAKPAPWET
jgi:uncharacterized protein (DUF1778 family)